MVKNVKVITAAVVVLVIVIGASIAMVTVSQQTTPGANSSEQDASPDNTPVQPQVTAKSSPAPIQPGRYAAYDAQQFNDTTGTRLLFFTLHGVRSVAISMKVLPHKRNYLVIRPFLKSITIRKTTCALNMG